MSEQAAESIGNAADELATVLNDIEGIESRLRDTRASLLATKRDLEGGGSRDAQSTFTTHYNGVPHWIKRVIHVDANDGSDIDGNGTSQSPYRTLEYARRQLGDGHALLLSTGSVFHESLRIGAEGKKGEPIFIGWYGDPEYGRPTIAPSSGHGISAEGPRRNLVINGVACVGMFEDSLGKTGIRLGSNSSATPSENLSVTIYDCEVAGFGDGIIAHGGAERFMTGNTVFIQNSIIRDNRKPGGGKGQGIYLDGVVPYVEDCIIANNGNNTLHDQGLYIQGNCPHALVARNWFVGNGSHGCQVRGGGIVVDNVFVDYANGMTVSRGMSSVERNLFMNAKDLGDTPRGNAIEVMPMSNCTLRDNLCVASTSNNDHSWFVQLGHSDAAVDIGTDGGEYEMSGNQCDDTIPEAFRIHTPDEMPYSWGWSPADGGAKNEDIARVTIEHDELDEVTRWMRTSSHLADILWFSIGEKPRSAIEFHREVKSCTR